MIKKNLLLITTVVVAIVSFTTTAMAILPSDNIVRGTLQAVDNSITMAVQYAEQLYIDNSGVEMLENVNIPRAHPYFTRYKINTTYGIELKFEDTQKTKENINAGIEGYASTTPGLYSAKILLVPVATPGDPSVASWECLTDADSYFGVLIYGGITPSDGDRSFITRYTTNPYLALCTYVSTDNPLF